VVIKDKHIVLGVTGGIAAYKALELTRLLKKQGAHVWPVMTKSAMEFITPLSFSTLAGNPVSSGLFTPPSAVGGAGAGTPRTGHTAMINHMALADRADLFVIVPATANIIGKIASGIADDLLSTVVMAAGAPVLIAPAMNHRMYENPVVKGNIEKLGALGYHFVGPGEGELACGWEGKGRLAPVEDIMDSIRECLAMADLAGEKVLVTAGATREAIDPVRFVSNSSSGRMGYELARAAKRRGAEVVLVSGQSALAEPPGVTFERVETASAMGEAAARYFPQSTLVIMAAAVADYRPVKSNPEKVKKGTDRLSIELERTEDILKEMGRRKNGQFLVGFALETEAVEENARKKLGEKNLDMVVANTPGGLSSETNEVTIIDSEGGVVSVPMLLKEEVAERILDHVVKLKNG
jgi:phosphopantothenoylcysteine decarboxylase/phosphopantothenate--cysteine ligase